MKKLGTIYKIENLVNGKVYVGQTIQDFEVRKGQHVSALRHNRHNNDHLQRAWNKYGENNFKFSIIEKCSYDTLDEKEVKWIKHYRESKGSYNLESGGNKHKRHSTYSKIKMSKVMKEITQRPEFKKKRAKLMKGKNNINAKKVICINTGEVFDTCTEAGKHYSINSKGIGRVCSGERKTIGGLQFAFYEEGKEYKLQEVVPMTKGNHPNARKVICIDTGKIYPSIVEASQDIGCNYDNIHQVCLGNNVCAKGKDGKYYQFAYYQEGMKYELKPIKNIKEPKKVICVNTGEIFDSTHEASIKTGVSQSKISMCCNGKRRHAGRLENGEWLVWEFLENYNPNKKYVFNKKGKFSNRKKRVKCLITGEIFDTITEAAERYEIKSSSNITMACKGKYEYAGRLPDGTKLKWSYID